MSHLQLGMAHSTETTRQHPGPIDTTLQQHGHVQWGYVAWPNSSPALGCGCPEPCSQTLHLPVDLCGIRLGRQRWRGSSHVPAAYQPPPKPPVPLLLGPRGTPLISFLCGWDWIVPCPLRVLSGDLRRVEVGPQGIQYTQPQRVREQGERTVP